MIGHLSGKLISKSPTLSVIDCAGVGYEVHHTPHCAEKLTETGVNLFIHTHVREDILQLFGFASLEERSLFRELLKVSGIGPKMALSILSGLPSHELIQALSSKDASRLQKIPGVGKKTAERLVVELADRLKNLAEVQWSESAATPSLPKESELESVLLNLGYQRAEIQRVIKVVRSRESGFETLALETLVRSSLRELTQGRPV